MKTLSTDWIERNIQKMIADVMMTARRQKPLPLSMSFHGVALKKFIAILQSKSVYFPKEDGTFDFLGIPVHCNNHLPYGTFVVERIDPKKGTLLGRC